MRNQPLATVVVNNFNYARFLADAIDSALAQSYANTEVVVVDDGSTDESREVIADYGHRVRAVLKSNGGQASAFNAGFAAGRGEVFCFLDADDMLDASAVEAAVGALASPEAVKVHWPLRQVDAAGRRTGELVPGRELCCGDLRELVLEHGPGSHVDPPTSGNAWKREYLDEVLPVPDEFRNEADAYLLELAPIFGAVARLPAPQGSYRLHGQNAGASMSFDERLAHDLYVHGVACDALAAVCRRQRLPFDRSRWRGDAWLRDVAAFATDLDEAIPSGQPFVLVDQGQLVMDQHAGRRAIPFPERDGIYWGRPAEDGSAGAELDRMRALGHRFIVFAWPAFWWLDHYSDLRARLEACSEPALRTDRALVFRFTS
jgi:glycosyltransferase involved in cell wall biosynthesis